MNFSAIFLVIFVYIAAAFPIPYPLDEVHGVIAKKSGFLGSKKTEVQYGAELGRGVCILFRLNQCLIANNVGIWPCFRSHWKPRPSRQSPEESQGP